MYIIAEIGSNYNSIEDCLKSIDIAKRCGADAVKFQHFTEKEMYGKGDGVTTPEHWLPDLHRFAKSIKIDFSCTFFDPNKLQKHLKLLDFIKIASSNMMDVRLLDVAKNSKLKTYVSTGGHELHEVQRVYDYFPSAAFLYCESVYPSFVNNYRKMRQFFFEGISDHSLDIFPDYPSCRVVEKHVNLVKTKDTPDAGHSLGEWHFRQFCRHVNNHGYRDESPLLSLEEVPMRSKYNVRLVATKDIGQGVVFDWSNVKVLRGLEDGQTYICPMDADKVIGNIAAKDIKAWSALGNRDIQATQSETEQVYS